MEGMFTTALSSACDKLKAESAEAAMAFVREFFEKNKEAIKKHFDDKSLDQTQAEMAKRLSEITEMLQPVQKERPQVVEAFLKDLKAYLAEEYQQRAKAQAAA